MHKIPHANVLASGLLAILIVAGGYITVKKPSAPPTQLALNTEQRVIAPEDIDTDGDLLSDWQENLYGSDMRMIDTDGDGTGDGDEVRVGRDPIKKAPNDELKYLQDPGFSTSSTDVEGIRKEYFAKYLAERGAEIKQAKFLDLIDKIDTEKYRPKHELVGLTVNSNNDIEGVKKYLNEFGSVIKKFKSAPIHPPEEDIIGKALETKKQSDFDELQLPIITYRNFTAELRALSVPSAIAIPHLAIVNAYDGMATGLSSIRLTLIDPMEGAAGYEAYMKYRLDVVAGYAGLVDYVVKNNIVFTEDEPGYPFYASTLPVETTVKQ